MRLDRHHEQWTLSAGGAPIAFIRSFNGAYWLYRDMSEQHPLGPYRSMLQAIKAVEPPRAKKRGPIYVAGTLRRRRFQDG
jgi:hypothetical protein